MASRRAFLAGLAATGLCPAPGWADVGNPDYLSATRMPDGSYALLGLHVNGNVAFNIALPGRGHAAAAHPEKPHAIAFARRPGTFAVVIDCTDGRILSRLTAPAGRHFYGHGVFSADGSLLFTTENDFEAAKGIIGIWDTTRYTRIDEVPSGGVGPHDIAMLSDGSLVVANGGIETHPDAGRAKLNIPTMRPNLSYLSVSGSLRERVELDSRWHRNSIRHLAIAPDDTVAFGMQWQGELEDAPPLIGVHRIGESPRFMLLPEDAARLFRGYVGSIAFDMSGQHIAITSPPGGQVGLFARKNGAMLIHHSLPDVGGVSAAQDGFILTSGTGTLTRTDGASLHPVAQHNLQWDNHLISRKH